MKLFKRFKLKRGKEVLNSTGGNYIAGQMIPDEAPKQIPESFQSRRRDAISDRSILMTLVGMLCNARTDFNDVDLYKEDTVFAHSFQIDRLPSEPTLRQRLDELPQERSHAALRGFNQILLNSALLSLQIDKTSLFYEPFKYQLCWRNSWLPSSSTLLSLHIFA